MILARFHKYIWTILVLLPFGIFLSTADCAADGRRDIRVAVATNFISTMEELAGQYEKETGIKLKRSSSATGVLYAQIVNGAPYDLFLAADEVRPKLLHRQGLCEAFCICRRQGGALEQQKGP